MQCTQCNSDNVQKLSLVYEQGTQNIQTTGYTTGSGVGVGSGGLGVGFGSTRTTTTGKSQSIVAQKAAPPDKKSLVLPIVMVIGGIFFLMASFKGGWAIVLGWGLIAAGGFMIWKGYQYNKNTYPPLYTEWQRSWFCNKCGSIFMQ